MRGPPFAVRNKTMDSATSTYIHLSLKITLPGQNQGPLPLPTLQQWDIFPLIARALHPEKASLFAANLVMHDSCIHGTSQRENRCVKTTIQLKQSFPSLCSTVSLGLHPALQAPSWDGSSKTSAPVSVVSVGTASPHEAIGCRSQ